ncbi:peptidylprolyl isomerase FKBP-type [Fibrella aestuarina BUZ 2]|uniref:peptidylprolyl isomerase n=1 Tax=Fibrella aestuarina BUZ 2 TaxID=1166018 RepID=I0K528_9BACT|nr:FKBP-type peptidyl-prolyl cis-trans isomerase [Fibrella aestuarina]CCG99231.1 peptidylprolyl isomerase FKBP-type [Fibrella aestuarina BUZ 2]
MRLQLSLFGIGLLAVIGVWLTSCSPTGEALADRKQRENAEEIQQYITANNLQAEQLGSTGVYYVKTASAPGNQSAVTGDEVRFFVVSRRFDGTVIDSTDGINPAVYTFGTNAPRARAITNGSYLYNNITDGMLAGIIVGREGEKLTLLVPSYYDNGRYGTLTLPQYSPIRYDMRIVSVRTEDEQIREYIAANKITVTDTAAGGIRIAKTLARPDSALIKAGETATIRYTGRLLNGTQFDSNVPTAAAIASDPSSATAGYDVTVGQTAVVAGWTTGLQQVRRGEKFLLIFPSSQGYGSSGAPNSTVIGPFKPLLFEMEILRVR